MVTINANNIYLAYRKNNIYKRFNYSTETEVKIGLSQAIVTDCAKQIRSITKTMNSEIFGNLLEEKDRRSKKRISTRRKSPCREKEST